VHAGGRPAPGVAGRRRRTEGEVMTTAFVLSGGAGLGAVQVGMLHALAARGIVPDLVVGTSVGAMNGAWFAGDPTPGGVDELDAIWRSLRQRSIFPVDPRTALLGFLGRRDHLVPPGPLERLLRRHLPYELLEDAVVPIHVVATDVMTGRGVVLSTGDTVAAVLASSAIPGVYPPVRFAGRLLMDGGVVDSTPVARAVELGADVLYVLPSGRRSTAPRSPGTALTAMLHALTILAEERLLRDIERFGQEVRLEVIPPPPTLTASCIDFGRTGELIEAAEATATGWLDRQHRRSAPRLVAVPGHGRQATISLEHSA
jgi:NTE family protein